MPIKKSRKQTVYFFLYSLTLITCFTACLDSSQKYKGYPEKEKDIDVLRGFVNPPKGYGNVPFYWWNGDTLIKERLAEQLDILSKSATDGFAVSYIHTDPKTDTLFNKEGHGLFGRTEYGQPAVFSDEWWEIWNWFSSECKQKGLGVGLDDYTVGWVGNGYYPDELDTMSVFTGYKGELQIDTVPLAGGELLSRGVPENLLSITVWPGKYDLTNHVANDSIIWDAPEGDSCRVYIISTKPGYIIHPEHGKKLVDVYFKRFESKMDIEGKGGMNYFFQDELSYPINRLTWSDDFAEVFQERKGYDIVPFLPALSDYIGAVTPKIRLDFLEVLMDLSEERYYKPIYDWHADRGLIYGCDNLGRGKNPTAYVDYFRMSSMYTAPGNDAPSTGSSFVETKVSSSVAHLYNRPRTWLEAFHSMGWGSSGAWLTKQIDHHFIAGGNLVCMHGLYYSTHGGWWEWAPPDFHFRMPYWPHMKKWLEYTERMSYLLSQGSHVCDIAMLYPTEPLQAYPEAKPDSVFSLGMRLSNSGLDYDFVDFRSMRDASITDKELHMADEKYKIVILADMKAIHHASLVKVRDFFRAGGIVLATGDLPWASDNKGEGDPEVEKIVKEIFGLSYTEARDSIVASRQTNPEGGVGWYIADGSLEKVIPALITTDFRPEKGEGKVLHRKAGARDIYMVTDVKKGSRCFFRMKGKVELWDATDGHIYPLPVLEQTEEGTIIRIDKETGNSSLIVFSSGKPIFEEMSRAQYLSYDTINLDQEWEVELKPTMNNKWGDYRFPAFDGYIGAEARSFRYAPAMTADSNWMLPAFNDSIWKEEIYGYGIQAETKVDDTTSWTPLSFSWQYGVWDNPGSQGYHGLKGKVDDGFFILDKGGHQQFRTFVYSPADGEYRIETDGVKPDYIEIDKRKVPLTENIKLSSGWHALLTGYKNTQKMDYENKTGALRDFRKRSAVVLYPKDAPSPEKISPYSNTIAMRWENTAYLKFDPYGGKYEQWNFRFRSAPGLEKMYFTLYGELTDVWFDGAKIPLNNIRLIEEKDQWKRYEVLPDKPQKHIGVVAFSVKPNIGYSGAGMIKEPVELVTGKGLMKACDWGKTGALLYYSGGMNYRLTVPLPKAKGKDVILDLGEVLATCEVKVNNKSVGTWIGPPYKMDITSHIKDGDNKIEVLVYSTLSNHYQTIPTPYRGEPKAGMIGPVKLIVSN